MTTIDCIKSNFTNTIVARCSEKGCKLRLNGLSDYIVLKGERICQDRKICDCIIFVRNNRIIGIVELKSRTAHPSEIKEKLINGSIIALDILEKCRDKQNYEFYHLVLSKSWRPPEYRVIISRRIIVRGKRYDIIPKRCGVSFSAVISDLK